MANQDIAKTLSKMVSVEEVIIDTVCEVYGKPYKEIEDAMNKSEFKKSLFDITSNFYNSDIELLVLEFVQECREKLNWTVQKEQAIEIVTDAMGN